MKIIEALKKIKDLAKFRLSRCYTCPFNSNNALESPYSVPFKHCTKCGCSLALKPYSIDSKCPIKMW